ncbi:hypothetical protein OHA21_50515 [Actinoplanes sp. NBC_00393]|uniref:hypothetical protein n=1 Tax=Actinoplanes sp. NBC_00393 TaxID=2975953 RepID=UPI002E1DA3AA
MPRRPRTALTRSAAIFGSYVGAAAVAATLPFWGLPGDQLTTALGIVVLAGFWCGQQLVRYHGALQVGGVFLAALLIIPTGLATHATMLARCGDQVTTVVTPDHLHTLDAIPQPLQRDGPDSTLGDQVDIVVDPDGRVPPKTAGEAAAATPLWITAGVGLVLTFALSVAGGRSRGSGRAPRKGPLGLWWSGH